MNKIGFAIAGVAVAAATASVLVAGTPGIGASNADPSASGSTYNVVGEPYAKAVAILRAQGVKTTFGGSVGSDVPQAQCLVKSEKIVGSKISLMLDCTAASQPQAPVASAPAATAVSGSSGAPATQAPDSGGRPTPGAPGVVTVVPTRVG